MKIKILEKELTTDQECNEHNYTYEDGTLSRSNSKLWTKPGQELCSIEEVQKDGFKIEFQDFVIEELNLRQICYLTDLLTCYTMLDRDISGDREFIATKEEVILKVGD